MAKKAKPLAAKKVKPLERHYVMPPDERIVVRTIEGMPSIDLDEARALLYGVTEKRKCAFLIAFSQLGSRTNACRAVGITTVTVWMWNKKDPAFAKAFVRAAEIASDLHEDELIRRGTEGVIEPVFQGGRLVGAVRRYSDGCLIAALKAGKPERYADRSKIDHSGSVDVVARLAAGRARAGGRALKAGNE